MKSKFLAKLIPCDEGGFNITLLRPGFSLAERFPTEGAALAAATECCQAYLNKEGQEWLQLWSQTESAVNCPEGALSLPDDVWHCKLTKGICPIQAVVAGTEQTFMAACEATPQRAQAIFETCLTDRYRGFHHVTGRMLCLCCETGRTKKESFRYHYPWEFAELDWALGLPMAQTAWILHAHWLPLNFVKVPLCVECCMRLADQMKGHKPLGLRKLELELPRPKHKLSAESVRALGGLRWSVGEWKP